MMRSVLITILLFSIACFSAEKGFRISGIEKGSIYQKLGLKNGDVIKEVNGTEPASVEAFGSWLSKTKAGDKVDLTIERKGKARTLHYTIN